MISKPKAFKDILPRVYIKTFGCQMNKLDTELSIGSLVKKGYSFAVDEKDADVILLNTCSVRDKAEHKVYSQLGSLRDQKEKNPELILGVLGCMAQNEGDKIFKRMPHVNLVCGTRMFSKLPELLEEISGSNKRILAIDEDGEVNFDRMVTQRQNRYNAFVSIMRGCDNYCSYCIVPYVRGREFSRPVTDIVDEVKSLADDGCKEITLLGQNVNSYGKGLNGKVTLATLLRELDPIKGIERIHFLTSHPKDMTKEILEAVGELELVEMAKSIVPGIKIASDFIVGFPGETEEDFQDTVNLLKDVRCQNSFIFKYSPRTGTAAIELIDDVIEETKKSRNHILLELQKKISTEENRKMHGKSVEVLVEGESKSNAGRLIGRTRQNQIVAFSPPEGINQADVSSTLPGTLVNIEIVDSTD
ncbi:MAG: MiaB/RimO family radical SAM methylthiotransferase, partial [Planctomycetota bacterium]